MTTHITGMDDGMLKTCEKRYGNHAMKLTQNINTQYMIGHYKWCIEDEKGHILYCGYSSGPPKGEVTEADMDEIHSSCTRR